MAISGFGNTSNNLRLNLSDKASTSKGAAKLDSSKLKGVKLNPIEVNPEPEEPTVKTNAVWVGYIDSDGFPHFSYDVELGDVVLYPDGTAERLCIDADGNVYFAKTTILYDDFECKRGDIRRYM